MPRTGRYDYDVALSFAGEDRKYVEAVARRLAAHVRVFYDRFEEIDLWGKDLYAHLDNVYRRQARYCVLFISERYRYRLWTNHERESAQARAFEENREYILPARFDDTKIPGVRPTTGYIDLRGREPEAFAELILKKVLQTAEEFGSLGQQATGGKTPKKRREAIRALARRHGVGAFHFLASLAWTSPYSAARVEALDQCALLRDIEAIPWMKEVVEEHSDNGCRARAAEHIVELQGLSAFNWALSILQVDKDPRDTRVPWKLGHALYRTARSESSTTNSGAREEAVATLQSRMLASLDGTVRECIIGSAILLSGRTPETREWAFDAARTTLSPYHRARSLAVFLRAWPEHGPALRELEALARGADEIAKDHAEAYLKWIREQNWRTVDWHLGLGRG